MMRKARYHGAEQDIPEGNSRRVEELERQLMFQDALMALLTQGEQMLVQEHVLEEHTWETLGKLYAERWYYEPTKRALQMRLKRAIDKLTEVCDRWLHATISDRKLRRPPGRKLLAYRIDREPLPPCKVRVKGQPLRGGLTRQAGWHGGHSQSIPAAISCKHQHTTGGRPCLIYAGSMTRISRKML